MSALIKSNQLHNAIRLQVQYSWNQKESELSSILIQPCGHN